MIFEDHFNHTNQSKVMELSGILQSLSKNDLSVANSMLFAKTLSDHLATIGDFILQREIVLYILNGLGSRYLTFVTTFNMTQVKTSVGVLHNKLEIFDRILLALEGCVQESTIFHANVAKSNSSHYG